MDARDHPADAIPPTHARRLQWFWRITFTCALIGSGVLGKSLRLPPLIIFMLMALSMLLLIPMVRATERAQAERGCASPAWRLYNRRVMASSFGYLLALFTAIMVDHQWHPSGVVLGLVAILPALPVLGMIWAMQRYLREERDEFLRIRFTHAALTGTGMLLAIATVWGFLETFHVAPHAPGWLAMPVWAVSMGLGRCFDQWRNA